MAGDRQEHAARELRMVRSNRGFIARDVLQHDRIKDDKLIHGFNNCHKHI